MKNLFNLASLFLVLAMISCSTTKKVDPKPSEVPVEITTPEIPVEIKPFLLVKSYTGFTQSNADLLKKSLAKANEVVASQCFEDFMLDRAIKKDGESYSLHSTNGKTAQEVVNDLRINQTTVELVYYYKRLSRVAGYTNPDTDKIWLNWKYHSGSTTCNQASNLAHEGSHKAPFSYDHAYNATYSRPWSVPYSINAAFEKCCK